MSLHNVSSMGCNDDVVSRWTYDYRSAMASTTMPNVLYSLIGYLIVNVTHTSFLI